jgi:20S proteasome subunit alpha 6
MFRNQYDTDVTTFSPQGRLHQVEYACEAVKQGSAVLGICSNTHVVLAALRRSPGELASYQKKLFKIDSHIGIGISGLVADARALSEFMRDESLSHRYVFGSPIDAGRLVTMISEQAQVYTQSTEKRPYGVGLLVAGYNEGSGGLTEGPRLFETSPAGVHYQFYAQAIGARSQACKTYLQKYQAEFANSSKDELILHAAKALQGAAQTASEFTSDSVSIGIVGKDQTFTLLSAEQVKKVLEQVPPPAGGFAVSSESKEEPQDREEEPSASSAPVEEEGKRMDLD